MRLINLALIGVLAFTLGGCAASVGPFSLDTGNPYLDIGGIIFMVLAIALGLRLIKRI